MPESKFRLYAQARAYGKLDISNELIVCWVENGRLRPTLYPKSWEEGVSAVKSPEAIKAEKERAAQGKIAWEAWDKAVADWEAANGTRPTAQFQYARNTQSSVGKQLWREYEEWMQGKPPYPEQPLISRATVEYPVIPTLLMGLNSDSTGYEPVYDPCDLACDIDPMMLLNFRRKV